MIHTIRGEKGTLQERSSENGGERKEELALRGFWAFLQGLAKKAESLQVAEKRAPLSGCQRAEPLILLFWWGGSGFCDGG